MNVGFWVICGKKQMTDFRIAYPKRFVHQRKVRVCAQKPSLLVRVAAGGKDFMHNVVFVGKIALQIWKNMI